MEHFKDNGWINLSLLGQTLPVLQDPPLVGQDCRLARWLGRPFPGRPLLAYHCPSHPRHLEVKATIG